jgi:hypothetical protein
VTQLLQNVPLYSSSSCGRWCGEWPCNEISLVRLQKQPHQKTIKVSKRKSLSLYLIQKFYKVFEQDPEVYDGYMYIYLLSFSLEDERGAKLIQLKSLLFQLRECIQ